MRLTRGSSTGEIWEISSDYPEARLSVGTDPGAGWPIQAPGVHPVHCELFWDGQSLWVADTHGAGGVFLDGRRVVDWAQIEGPAELRLGQAALDVETSAPLHEQMVSSPNAARPVTLTDLVAPPDDGRRSRPIFGGAASDDSIPELDVAATRVVASPVPDLDAERTRVASAPSAAPNADLRPRLGGSGSAVTSEATRMVAMPTARPASAPPPPPPARVPQALAPAPVVAPPPAPPSIAAPPALPPALSAEPDPSIAPPAPPSGGPAFVGPPVEPKPPAKTSGFAQVAQQVLAKLRPQSSAEVVQASGGKTSQTLPTRTWILLGVTVAAAVGLLLWEEDPEEIAAPQPTAQTQQAPVVVAGTGAQQGAPPSTPPAVPPQPVVAPEPPPIVEPVAQANPAVEAPPATPSAPVAEGSQATPSADQAPVGPSMQRQAIDRYIAGRYPEALALYRQLAAADPANEAYASMVHILEARVRCHDGVGPGGQPCTE